MPEAAPFKVLYDPDAIRELEGVKSKRDRKAVFNAIDKLRRLGPKLTQPHVKALKGTTNLLELRPRAGSCDARPVCRRLSESQYVVLAIAPTHADLDAAQAAAQERAEQYLD